MMNSQTVVLSENNLAERLRRDNCDQFNVLVRMHLSFVLDFHTEEDVASDKTKYKMWPFYKKNQKHGVKGVMEGAPLTREGICLVYQLIKFLRKESNIKVEGIFRRTGSLIRQHDLKNLLNQGSTISLEDGTFNVHDCASVLKAFLADLPEPLLTDAHFPSYCQLAKLCGLTSNSLQEVRLLRALQLILLLLPVENRELLKDVLDLLHLTQSYEKFNKMSAYSLAILFTPHLLFPRKSSLANLHTDSQNLFGIVAFMIEKSNQLFDIPPKLAIDIKAYYTEQEKRKIESSKKDVNESICDTARTVYSFIDREKTAQENQSNPTETALAQLYAHIQSMPESSKKRKLIKQFNKENGQGVPLQVLRSAGPEKSTGNSLKKFKSLAKAIKINGFGNNQRSQSEETLNTHSTPRKRLFCTCSSSLEVSNTEEKQLVSSLGTSCDIFSNEASLTPRRRSKSYFDLSSSSNQADCVTSTPAIRNNMDQNCTCSGIAIPNFTPNEEDHGRQSMSPITRSTQRMSKIMQETMMTPRSRKPVLLVSVTNLNSLPKMKKRDYTSLMDSMEELSEPGPMKENYRTFLTRSKSTSSLDLSSNKNEEDYLTLSENFKKYLNERDILVNDESKDKSEAFSEIDYLTPHKMTTSMLEVLDGKDPEINNEKELVLRPKQFDENGVPTVYETSF